MRLSTVNATSIYRMSTNTNDWFTSWFNTPYYHILYKDRGHDEAQAFMNALTQYIHLPEEGHILDLACGRGRHSLYLNSIGFEVTGVDLSEESIAYAKQFENDRLHFEVHDMCLPYGKQFDAVFNLFTSFGYFEHEEDNLKTIKAIKSNLKPDGIGVIDFLNVPHVLEHLVEANTKTIEGITFHMTRSLEDGYIVKNIKFEDQGNSFHFQERVKAFTLDDFKAMFEQAGLTLLEVFGDYHLRPYHATQSERLIMTFM